MEHRYMIIIFYQQKGLVYSQIVWKKRPVKENRPKKVAVKYYSSFKMWKTSFFEHWDCSAFWSPLLPLYRWHEWCMLVSGPDVVTPQHNQLGALFYLSVSLWYFLTDSADALLSDGAVCLWPWGRWKTAITEATVLSIQIHKPHRLKTVTLVA